MIRVATGSTAVRLAGARARRKEWAAMIEKKAGAPTQ
jgi:hypothetical protein